MSEQEGIKITAFEVENVKRVKLVRIEPSENGLTIIGGGNGQGKTSLLDGIVWTLGGDRKRPSDALRDGAEKLHTLVEFNTGLIAERLGKNGRLKITGGTGKQSLLDELISEISIDAPKFMGMTDRDKAKFLLKAFPDLEAPLQRFDEQIKAQYEERTSIGRDADRKEKYAGELPYHDDAPDKPLSGAEMTEKLTKAVRVNARNAEIRASATKIEADIDRAKKALIDRNEKVQDLETRLTEAKMEVRSAGAYIEKSVIDFTAAQEQSATLKDVDTSEINTEMEQIDVINSQVRDNASKRTAEHDAVLLRDDYVALSAKIDELRQGRTDLLQGANLPLPELGLDEDGSLTYRGYKWDCMATSDQYKIAAALGSSLKPSCKFVLLDRLESLDKKMLREFDAWMRSKGLQGICTRVGDDGTATLIIEDGMIQEKEEAPKWKL